MSQGLSVDSGSEGPLVRVRVSRAALELVSAEAEFRGVAILDVWDQVMRRRAEVAAAERAQVERRSRPAFGGRWPEEGWDG